MSMTDIDCASNKPKATGSQSKSWRDVLPVHPAAGLFPSLSHDELVELGEDIRKNGLAVPIALYRERVTNEGKSQFKFQLLDGRNRLDALEAVGIKFEIKQCGSPGEYLRLKFPNDDVYSPENSPSFFTVITTDDPFAYVLSTNIHRRHLTSEQKRELISKVLKAKPERSNRAIAKQVKADDKTVGKVRRDLESTAEFPQLEKTTGTDGKARPARSTVFKTLRTMKLGEETIDKINGTSLDNAKELDALIVLNRGAPKGELTDIVKQLIADAVAGENVSAIAAGKFPNYNGKRGAIAPRADASATRKGRC
jgi:hypothetical protein